MGHARGFSGARTRGWYARALGPSDFLRKSKILGNCRARRKILGVICRKFWDFLGFSHHQTTSFAGAPIATRERCHVTQPRARINVSCSRAGHKGAKGAKGTHERTTREGQQRVGTRPGYQTGGVPDQQNLGGERLAVEPTPLATPP